MRGVPGFGGRILAQSPAVVVSDHGGTVRTASGPVAAGPVLGHGERWAVGLGSGQNVMPVGTVAATADDVAFLGKGGLLGEVVGAMKLIHIPGDDRGFGVPPWTWPDAITGVDGRLPA